MLVQNDSELAFLDVLLVNAEKYNQVIIQNIKPAWISQTLSRLARSPLHFNKFFEILVDMVVSERHPEWSNRAIQWLNKVFDNPETAEMAKKCSSSMSRFVSFSVEMMGVGKLVDSTLKSLKCIPRPSKRKKPELVIVETNYVFIDDPELNFGALLKRSRKRKSATESEEHGDEIEFDEMSALSGDEGASISEDDNFSEISEDDGVFDVDRNSLSSFTGSQNSTSFPQPRTAGVNHNDVNDDGSSDPDYGDAQIGTDNSVSEDDEDDNDAANLDQPPPSTNSSSGGEEEKDYSQEDKAINGTQGKEQDYTSGDKSGAVLRRSPRIRKAH
ncbi:hypothetical protein Aperf_G00000020195 [Anoplocephala perfoliata]